MNNFYSHSAAHRLLAFELYMAKQRKIRRYCPGGYVDWWEYLSVLHRACKRHIGQPNSTIDVAAKAQFSVLAAHTDDDIPARYVSKELAQAWLKTKTPEFNWNHPYVLPGYVLFLPGSLEDCGVTTKVVCVQYIPPAQANPGTIVFCGFSAAPETNFARPTAGYIIPGSGKLKTEKGSLSHEVVSFVVNSWLIHLHEPGLIEQVPVSVDARGFGHKAGKRPPIAPTWIGRNFKIRRELVLADGQETGVKVRPHWRSGHWHTVRHGKGKEHTRTQWYRPVYVNADQAA